MGTSKKADREKMVERKVTHRLTPVLLGDVGQLQGELQARGARYKGRIVGIEGIINAALEHLMAMPSPDRGRAVVEAIARLSDKETASGAEIVQEPDDPEDEIAPRLSRMVGKPPARRKSG